MADFSRHLNDALFNAGLRGFCTVLQRGKEPVTYDSRSVLFSSSALEHFSQAYFATMMETFKTDIIFAQLEQKAEVLKNLDVNHPESTKQMKDLCKYIGEKIKRNSYLSAYEILQKKGVETDFLGQLDQIKKATSDQEKQQLYVNFIGDMEKHKEVFQLKDIAYTKIQPFWSNFSFLLKTENKTDFYQAYEKSFMKPIQAFIRAERKPPKGDLCCCQCQTPITRGEASGMSWINDQGVDVNRKTSYFWNHAVDSFLCPICNLIYSCIPLGFQSVGTNSIFVNQNNTMKSLMNSGFKIKTEKAPTSNDPLYLVIRDFLEEIEQETAEKSRDNIQVLTRKDNRYYHYVLSKELMAGLLDCRTDIHAIRTVYIYDQDRSFSLVEEVMHFLLKNMNLYLLLYKCIYISIKDNKPMYGFIELLRIQEKFFRPKPNALEGVKKSMEKLIKRGYMGGKELRKIMLRAEKNENKLRGLSFKLLSALKSKNENLFTDTLIRQYFSEGEDVPSAFIEVLKQEEVFLKYGYAFLIGLNAGYEKKTETTEDATIHKEDE